ncbi:hypothetical protein P4N68_01530 [Corynebacterium felinum]|uniref:Uncharacterized protein n=1 Tax=Corynebacterium felinum TaxID=131318 RepID=A0ABU2B9D2_9CORY|nr:hypothetical protein [Corynebacterium felinum]MDF5819761.1 hypothetical protein [Corynebacterium felinum]MDR7354373.1 hypothetical protein [Corynebacterium felinum]WJY93744.1 hypothetical protein CFELI_00435 [Corynebacterium felinum]
MPHSLTTQTAQKYGLPAPIPSRWEEISDELFETYIRGIQKIIDDPDSTSWDIQLIIMAVNEHAKTRHKHLFDVVLGYYYTVKDHVPRSQIYFTLEKIGGSSKATVDKFLEIYNTDHDTLKHYFMTFFAEKGTQKHWDTIANSADCEEDIRLLKILADSKKRQLTKHNVNPWIPELKEN